MTELDILKMLRPSGYGEESLVRRFGEACRDPHATITAVNDLDSFSRVIGKRRKDRLRKLYELYISISKTRLALSMENLELFKRSLPSYKRVSMFYFLEDLMILLRHGIILVDTPLLDALEGMKQSKRDFRSLVAAAGRPESDREKYDALIEHWAGPIEEMRPPTVYPNV